MKLPRYITERLEAAQASKMLESLASNSPRFSMRAVDTRVELEAACRLLYREYRRRGYCSDAIPQLHYNPHMFASESRTFIISSPSNLLGTISVFPDSSAGIPADALFRDEIDSFRRKGIRFAEVGLLATDLESIGGYSLRSPEKMQIVFSLFKVMVSYSLYCGISHLVILVNPKHAKLYRFLGFKVFSDVRAYHGACGAPALPMILELSYFQTRRDTRRWFLENPAPIESFRSQLAGDPQSFAELFGESFHDFNDRYNQNIAPRAEVDGKPVSAPGDTLKFSRFDLDPAQM